MVSYKLLLVEDDEQIREVIIDYFVHKGKEFEMSVAEDGIVGEKLLYENEYDIVLLDVMLPGLDGFALCRELRKNSTVPIVFLTAKNREEDILYGYELGCDDYMVKPFLVSELFAKVKALLQRSKGMIGAKELVCGCIRLDPITYRVYIEDEEIELPPKEYALLKFLMEHKGRPVTRDTLLTKIWGYDFDGNERVVDNHIKILRKKLGSAGEQIRTVITKGYKIDD